MLRLDKVIKPWKESASLNDHINLYGFWNETVFLTKSGDVGMVLRVPGVDYESLDHAEQEYAVKRLEAALKAFGPGFHVYQYLFKSNRPDIPFANYDDPVVETAIDQRRQFFETKRNHLYQVEIFYAIVLEGPRSKSGVGAAFAQLFRDPAGALGELRTQFTNDSMKVLLCSQIENELARLDQKVQAFARQLEDFMQIEVLDQQRQFRFFRRLAAMRLKLRIAYLPVQMTRPRRGARAQATPRAYPYRFAIRCETLRRMPSPVGLTAAWRVRAHDRRRSGRQETPRLSTAQAASSGYEW
jgi:type IV secretory pathway VirB4 component